MGCPTIEFSQEKFEILAPTIYHYIYPKTEKLRKLTSNMEIHLGETTDKNEKADSSEDSKVTCRGWKAMPFVMGEFE